MMFHGLSTGGNAQKFEKQTDGKKERRGNGKLKQLPRRRQLIRKKYFFSAIVLGMMLRRRFVQGYSRRMFFSTYLIDESYKTESKRDEP